MLTVPVKGETTPHQTNEDCLEAARRVAMVLAYEGEPGFDLVRTVRSMGEVADDRKNREIPNRGDRAAWQTLYRLFLLADHDRVPKSTRQAASYAGGVSLNESEIRQCNATTIPCGIVLKHAHVRLCTHLKTMYLDWCKDNPLWNLPTYLRNGRDAFMPLENEQGLAWIVGAALSAADQMLALQDFWEDRSDHWKRRWNDQIGGGHARDDPVTPWIDGWLYQYREEGCHCTVCLSAGYKVTDFRAVGQQIELNAPAQHRCLAGRAQSQPPLFQYPIVPTQLDAPKAKGASPANAAQIPLQSKADLHKPVQSVAQHEDPPNEKEAAQPSRSYYTQGASKAMFFDDIEMLTSQ